MFLTSHYGNPTKFKSTNTFAILIWDPTTKLNFCHWPIFPAVQYTIMITKHYYPILSFKSEVHSREGKNVWGRGGGQLQMFGALTVNASSLSRFSHSSLRTKQGYTLFVSLLTGRNSKLNPFFVIIIGYPPAREMGIS